MADLTEIEDLHDRPALYGSSLPSNGLVHSSLHSIEDEDANLMDMFGLNGTLEHSSTHPATIAGPALAEGSELGDPYLLQSPFDFSEDPTLSEMKLGLFTETDSISNPARPGTAPWSQQTSNNLSMMPHIINISSGPTTLDNATAEQFPPELAHMMLEEYLKNNHKMKRKHGATSQLIDTSGVQVAFWRILFKLSSYRPHRSFIFSIISHSIFLLHSGFPTFFSTKQKSNLNFPQMPNLSASKKKKLARIEGTELIVLLSSRKI